MSNDTGSEPWYPTAVSRNVDARVTLIPPTTETTSLAAWLLECIEVDEAVARAATAGPWRSWVEGRDGFGGDDVILTTGDDIYPSCRVADQDHIARHDPARVLAQCKAHRAIVEGEPARVAVERHSQWERTLRDLAGIYADRPGFDARWVL